MQISQPAHRDYSRAIFLSALVALGFLYGAAVGRYQFFPFPQIQFALGSLKQVFADRDTILGIRPSELLEPARHAGRGVTQFDRVRTQPGLRLLVGFFDEDLELRLIRLDGSVVNRWPARFHDIFPETTHVRPADRVPQSNWNAGIQGARLLPDGSAVFNFEGLGLAKLDRCGATTWTVKQMTHHSVDFAEGGGFWVPSTRYVEKASAFPGFVAPFDEDTILRVSDGGAILDEISVPRLFFENHLEALLFANGLEGIRVPEKQNLTHLNDVEELKSRLAPRFPQFAKGDLLVSLRNYNLVMVIDPRAHKVKWHQTGPWVKQHDPDFEANGRISVFNNNSDGTKDGHVLGGSNILEVDPRTGTVDLQYGSRDHQRMYTEFRGKHEILPNGNMLVTESHAGRVFEIDPNGNVVWEFVNRYEEGRVAVVTGANWYDEAYFTNQDWACQAPAARRP